MTLLQVEKRVKALENKVRRLARSTSNSDRKWYRTQAGRFAKDSDFDQILKLGRAYRTGLKNSKTS